MTVIGSESQVEQQLRDFASAGAIDFVASIPPVSRKRNAWGAAQCSHCGVWWVGFNQLPAGNMLRA